VSDQTTTFERQIFLDIGVNYRQRIVNGIEPDDKPAGIVHLLQRHTDGRHRFGVGIQHGVIAQTFDPNTVNGKRFGSVVLNCVKIRSHYYITILVTAVVVGAGNISDGQKQK
jgi:hypothetical protein